MDLVHYFFYFGVALVECLTFAQMERPRDWFGYSVACFVLSWVLYAYDYRLILRQRSAFDHGPPERALYQHILATQRFEMSVLMPAGLAYSLVAYLLVVSRPQLATTLAVIQLGFTLGFVASFVRNFTRRQQLLSAAALGDESR